MKTPYIAYPIQHTHTHTHIHNKHSEKDNTGKG